MGGPIFHIVILERFVLLAKRPDADWRALQDEFVGYKTSLGPYDLEDVIEFIAMEWPHDAAPETALRAFAAGAETLIVVVGQQG